MTSTDEQPAPAVASPVEPRPAQVTYQDDPLRHLGHSHRRGDLRIYLGAAPGVGKTCAMLGEAHRRLERGTDVVAAVVETHGRKKVGELIHGIEVIPPHYISYRGGTFPELDVEAVLRRRPEGVILTGGVHTPQTRRMLSSAGIPVIETWDLPPEPIDQVVGFSNEEAMRMLITTLAAKGYRRFGYVGGRTTRDSRGEQRRKGFMRALDELGFVPGRIVSWGVPPISIEHGGPAIMTLLERWPDTEVVAFVSDLPAFGALMECKRRNIQVPERVAIAGFGDYEVGGFSHPRMTTVNVDCYGIGKLAARRVIELLQAGSRNRHDEIILTSFRVVEREST